MRDYAHWFVAVIERVNTCFFALWSEEEIFPRPKVRFSQVAERWNSGNGALRVIAGYYQADTISVVTVINTKYSAMETPTPAPYVEGAGKLNS